MTCCRRSFATWSRAGRTGRRPIRAADGTSLCGALRECVSDRDEDAECDGCETGRSRAGRRHAGVTSSLLLRLTGALRDQRCGVHSRGAFRRLELKQVRGHGRQQSPLAHDGHVLRLARLAHVGDRQLSNDRLLAGIDPDLPLDGRLRRTRDGGRARLAAR